MVWYNVICWKHSAEIPRIHTSMISHPGPGAGVSFVGVGFCQCPKASTKLHDIHHILSGLNFSWEYHQNKQHGMCTIWNMYWNNYQGMPQHIPAFYLVVTLASICTSSLHRPQDCILCWLLQAPECKTNFDQYPVWHSAPTIAFWGLNSLSDALSTHAILGVERFPITLRACS